MPQVSAGAPGYKQRHERFANKLLKYFPTKTFGQFFYDPMEPESEWERQVNQGNIKIFEPWTGSGAPALGTVPTGGSVGEFYFRTDTPGTASQRIYVCTVAGTTSAIGTFVGIA